MIAGLWDWSGPAVVVSVKRDLIDATRVERDVCGEKMVVDPSELAGSVILDQVTNGVAVRMAVLFRLLGSGSDLKGDGS